MLQLSISWGHDRTALAIWSVPLQLHKGLLKCHASHKWTQRLRLEQVVYDIWPLVDGTSGLENGKPCLEASVPLWIGTFAPNHGRKTKQLQHVTTSLLQTQVRLSCELEHKL